MSLHDFSIHLYFFLNKTNNKLLHAGDLADVGFVN